MSNKYPGGIITSGANAGYSVAFDGTGDYLQAGSNAALAPGSGNFTLEFFVYPVGSANFMGLYQNYTDGLSRSTAFRISINGTDNTSLVVQTQASALITTSTGVMTANAWNHVALVRNGSGSNNLVLYVNGVSRGTATNTTNFSDGFAQIGNTIYNGTNYTWNGYISNFRLVVGTALYTSTFTPPTQLLAITNTSLLTCNSPAIVDQSSNNFTITTNGNAAPSTFTPFVGYQGFNPALGAAAPGIWTLNQAQYYQGNRLWPIYDPYFNRTTLLLHGNGTNGAQNNTFLDSSSNNFTITRNGNTTQGSFSPFSQTGWSTYFPNSSSQGLTLPSGGLGSGDFTLEYWMYPSSLYDYITTFSTTRGATGFNVGTDSAGLLVWYSSGARQIAAGKISANQWHHAAFVRSGNTLTGYLNGVAVASATVTTNFSATSASIGSLDGGSEYLTGYLSNLRIVVGTAVYTSNFTPPSAPLTAITNTRLLTCQSNRFVDNSSNALALTINGTTSVQAFSPFVPTYSTPITYSNLFDGSGDFLTVPNNSAFLFGTGDFTVEFWVNFSSISSTYQCIAAVWQGATNYAWNISINNANVSFAYGNGGSSGSSVTFACTPTTNTWAHFAVTRASNSVRCFLNGAQIGTTQTISNNLTSGTSLYIGANQDGGPTQYVNGCVSNLRIVKGTAVYTANFTPPTGPLTNITNTSLLTCQSSTFIDNSSNAFTITANGNVQPVASPNPFGFNADQTTMNSAYTPALQGGSGYFDGSGDYLTTGTASALNFGTGNFTIEAWYYLTSTTNLDATMIADGGASYTSTSKIFKLYWFGQNFPALDLGSGNGSVSANNTAARLNQWNHVALVRSGNTFTMYLNGVAGTPVTFTGSVNFNGNNNTFIGFSNYNTPTNGYFTGYIAGLRATNTAVYSANFTPPIAPPTSVSGTSLLLNYTNAGIIDSTGDNVLETVGNAQISTTQSKFGGSSLYFDGNGDYLFQGAGLLPYTFGTGDFTIEFWLYLNSVSVDQMLIDMRPASTQGAYPAFYFKDSDNTINWYVSTADRITSSALSISTWYHVAVCRSGTSTRMFLNGTQTGSTYSDSTNYLCSRVVIGAQSFTLGSIPLNAYIDDFRISLYARYTGNFTPQTSQWQDQ